MEGGRGGQSFVRMKCFRTPIVLLRITQRGSGTSRSENKSERRDARSQLFEVEVHVK